ncbi:zinc finger protein 507 [Xiphophorus hellerii]|uniref:zinc finger protein 507 n=1 Tax=Xiphophorus hellerii TaxID=8084 RepID=UPI0013B454A2|nr:zinc finger protein 507 [Xiphophorus hellerii]
MDENCSVAVLISKSSSTSDASSSAPVPGSPFEPQPHRVIGQGVPGSVQPKQVDESLIQVIEKLSKIVEQRPQRHCPLGGQKRGKHLDSSEVRLNPGSSPNKRMKNSCDEEARADGSETDDISSSLALGDNNNNITTAPSEVAGGSSHIDLKRTVTCYQCSLCPYLSQTLAQLREHLKQHNEQHSDLILMCSECHFTSRDQEQLEAHVKLHFDDRGDTTRTSTEEDGVLKQGGEGERDSEASKGSLDESSDPPKKKKWYSYEEYGLYRCLICSYVCSQQRMLKTHAWKHAGLVDCSYPIFEEEEGGPARQETQAATNSIIPREDLVILSPGLHDQNLQKLPAAIKLQLCVPVATENQQDQYNPPVSHSSEDSGTAADEDEEKGYTNKDVSSEEPVVEVQVTMEGDGDMEVDRTQESSSVPDSLLSSAQKIINSSPNSAGHINVIVERLPSAEDTVMVTKPLLLNPDVDRDKGLLAVKEEEEQNPVGSVVCVDNSTNNPSVDADCKSPLPKGDSSLRDENIPPTSRKRTHSESLRLHSLAAEALVAMPMRMPELPTSSPKVTLKSALPQIQNQRILDGTQNRQRASDVEKTAALLDLELCQAKQGGLGTLGLVEGDEEGPTTKAGISLSLLTVIERLRERSDQNTSDEDILKELQDNAQFHNGAVAAAITGNGAESYVCNIPGIDGLVGPADGGLVDYNPGNERPYRCRLCHYSSGNKGYIKQHMRVHRQRAPYQCPICEHKASDSKDLENHMIYHCKSRMHQCKYCSDAFHYKNQLRSHEREHHSCSSDTPSPTTGTDTITPVEESERGTDEEGGVPKMYKCDVCNYTSSTYVGVRNHRRIHNSDKPYRCCSCDFATTNMNSLKSHMRRHPQEHQAVQLLEQYRCSLCGYVCSHPPSLKSHMWKHAGDQNYNYEQVNKAINEAISQSSRPAGPPTPPPDSTQCPAQGKNPALSQGPPRTGPPMEYCMLLFCCCICGFESTSKERLMEHMKEHEGDIISIILNKEQHQQEAEAQAGLLTAE